ncbi:MAG: PKD domain-containing protein [Bacteroidales bacterium]
MRVILLILLIFSAFFHAPGQIASVAGEVTSCDADFTVIPDPLNPMVFHFTDQSGGQITLWQWSFGDGTSTTLQNPVHTYLHGGTYFVCLTVSNSEPGNICHDVMCIYLTVHEPGTCVADFQYTIDPLDQFKVHFTDQSTGNINRWHWVFGDGTSSEDRNPSHTFITPGDYRVCLTAYNADSVSVCNDIKCDSLKIIPALPCHASFTSALDSINPVPNTFLFKDVSAGNPNKFLWKFNDGATFTTREVVHQFQTPGEHEVCLVIKREEHGDVKCIDSICRTITSAQYYDIGGHLFAGAYPINNPVSTSDTGVAYLFRADGQGMVLYDSSRFTQLGYYAFPAKLNGSYIIRAALTSGSLHFPGFFPTYYQQGLAWKETNTLNLGSGSTYVADIHLVPTVELSPGPGSVSGTVVKETLKDNFQEISFAEVILYDAGMTPARFSITGKSGQFGFQNLPPGMYHLYVEYPGKFSRLTSIWLDSNVAVVDSLRLEVFDHDVTGLNEGAVVPALSFDLFPNPSGSIVNLAFQLGKAAALKVEIRTLTGQPVWDGTLSCTKGANMVALPVGEIGKGLYLVVIKTMEGGQMAVKKLVRY